MDSSRTIEEKLKQSEIGKEMLEGEEAVSIVTDAIKGTAGRWAPVPVPAASASDSDPPAFDIDSRDRMDEFGVTEYTKEIYAFLRANERRSLVDHTYMARQGDINAKMRVILNDWLVEVHLKFKLRQETLYLCFQLIDRFLETNDVKRQKLQLVGVTGLMLASKYEEIYPPEVRDYVYICDNAYTREEILGMEQTMLAKLEYRLSLPTVWCFMKRFCKAAGRQIQRPDSFFFLVSYLVELAMIQVCPAAHMQCLLTDNTSLVCLPLATLCPAPTLTLQGCVSGLSACRQIRMLRFVPSELVAASIYLSNMLREDGDCWTEQLQHHTGYSVTDLECCVGELRSLLREAPKETVCGPSLYARAIDVAYLLAVSCEGRAINMSIERHESQRESLNAVSHLRSAHICAHSCSLACISRSTRPSTRNSVTDRTRVWRLSTQTGPALQTQLRRPMTLELRRVLRRAPADMIGDAVLVEMPSHHTRCNVASSALILLRPSTAPHSGLDCDRWRRRSTTYSQ
jgi:hypothetical protein